MAKIPANKKESMKNREELWQRMNFYRDKNGQARFPTYGLGPSEMDPSPKKKGR